MKFLRYLTITILSLSLFLVIETASNTNAYGWIDGTPLLHDESIFLLNAIGKNTRPTLAPGLEGVRNDPIYSVGDIHQYYALNMRNNSQYTLQASCYAVTDKAYIFVEKGTSVTQDKINALANSFDRIYSEITKNFGMPPTKVVNDPRVNLLIMDIVDGARQNGVMTLGYFSPMDQFTNIELAPWTRKKSNETNILYIDSISLSSNKITTEAVIAHEFTHLIQWARDPEESTWVDEGLAVYAENMLGYSNDVKAQVSVYAQNPNVSLINWDNKVENYGAAYLYFAYLSEKFGGVPLISDILKNEAQDVDGIIKTLSAKGITKSFSDIFSDWVIANYLDDPNLEDGRYGYSTLNIKLNSSLVESQYPIDQKSSSVLPWSVKYIEFQKGQDNVLNLSISENDQNNINARLIGISADSKVIVSLVKSISIQSGSASIPKENIKTIFVVTSQPDPPDSKQDKAVFAYSAESHTVSFAVTPSGSKITTWGSIKHD
ncbi:MAG: hypothetical protein QG588_2151 [Candidatus Poribacteria bacterium]|nr:hypothetical protein [Candidatus Poribacteria bacterium]